MIRPGGEEHTIRAPGGRLCSSFRAEMVALDAALHWLVDSVDDEDPIVICTNSQSALASLRAGPPAQSSPLGVAVWDHLARLAWGTRQVHLQWVPSHCDLEGNGRANSAQGGGKDRKARAAAGVRPEPRSSGGCTPAARRPLVRLGPVPSPYRTESQQGLP